MTEEQGRAILAIVEKCATRSQRAIALQHFIQITGPLPDSLRETAINLLKLKGEAKKGDGT